MSPEEKFTLAFAKFEDERLKHSPDEYNAENYLSDEFHFSIHDTNASNTVYHVIKKAWSEGLLELFIKNNVLTDKLEVKDLVALDSTRFVKLVVEVLKLELIEEKEAWGLLFLNAERIQDTFSDANDFKSAYCKGALFYDILFQSEEEERGEKIQNFDTLFQKCYASNSVELTWLKKPIFSSFSINPNQSNSPSTDLSPENNNNETVVTTIKRLLKKEDKTVLWDFLDELNKEERNQFLNQLYDNKKEESHVLTNEEYLELPALYPDVSYAHYLRGIFFYYYAWEARGLGITNTVGQKNYALFYERLRYARNDLKKAYELAPNEQTYWADLYNLMKHFRSKEADLLQEELYARILKDAMQNPYCIQRVSHLNKARWGGSHQESLDWAREVVRHNEHGSPLKIIIFKVLIEQHKYILEFDRDEERANAVFQNLDLQNEVNECFDELVAHVELQDTLLFWYEKVGDVERIKILSNI